MAILIGLSALLGLAIYALVGWFSPEPRLNPKGSAYELNLDDMGRLWISDSKAKQVWSVDPISGNVEIYHVSGSPIDARQAGGWLWWADGQSNLIGQVSISEGSYTEWQIPDAVGFLGTSLDTDGRLYTTDSSNPFLYRLDPEQAELCTYTLPGFGASNYIVRDGQYLWLGDWFDSTLLRIQTSDDSLAWWSLPAESSPFGMAVDVDGNLWYADQNKNALALLNPDTNQLTSYALPIGDYPQMIAFQSGMIWYSEQSLPSFGRLDPLAAQYSTLTLTVQNQQLTPSCTSISPSGTGKTSITKGKMTWPNSAYTAMLNAGGWQIFQLPKNSDPWGIAFTNYGFVVDSGRQVLVRFDLTQEIPPILLATGMETSPITLLLTPTATPTAIPTQPLQEFFRVFLAVIFKDFTVNP